MSTLVFILLLVNIESLSVILVACFLVKTCRDLVAPDNGQKSSDDTGCGSFVNFTCSECYNLTGYAQLECLPNGTWSNDEPSCER